jgi:transposase
LNTQEQEVLDRLPTPAGVIEKSRWLSQAVHVLDRFHIMQHFGKALDEIRAEESKQLKRDGYEPILKKSRWCFLKRRENLTESQTVKLSVVLKYNLRSVRAYLHREEFQQF